MKKIKISTVLSAAYIVLNLCLIGGMAIWFYGYNHQITYEDGVANIVQNTASVMKQVDSCLTSMEQTIVDTLANADFVDNWVSYQKNGDEQAKKKVKMAMINAYKNKLDVRRVIIYDEEGNCICTGQNSVSREEIQERFCEVREKYDLENYANSRVFLEPHVDFWQPELAVTVIAEIKPVKNRESQIVGYIEVQQNKLYITDACKMMWNKDPLSVFVFFGDYNICLYERITEDCGGTAVEYSKLTEQYMSARRYEESIVATSSSNYYNCRTVAVLPNRIMYKSLNHTFRSVMMMAGFVVIFTVCFILLMTRIIMHPVKRLISRMQNTDLDNLSIRRTRKRTNWETEIVESTFDEMSERLFNAVEKQQEMAKMQTKTLFGILQAEIGPHFLYNSLGSIANMCERGENEEAADMCYSLTEILRYSSSYATPDVLLSEEIANLNSYMTLMKGRYRHRISYEINVSGNVNHLVLPKLTLQPLVENAIKYALMEEEMVKIKVDINARDAGNVTILVKDNGCGFSEETKQMIEERINKYKKQTGEEEILENIQFGGMGLSGTLIRLGIFFGDTFRYKIFNNEDGPGTTILLEVDMRY